MDTTAGEIKTGTGHKKKIKRNKGVGQGCGSDLKKIKSGSVKYLTSKKILMY